MTLTTTRGIHFLYRAIVLTVLTAYAGMSESMFAVAQSADNASRPFWPTAAADERVTLPSPEAASLPVAPEPQVDLATGRGSLSFSLAQWQVGAHTMSLGLSYRLGAFHTDEWPGWLGLGWSFEGLGVVTRRIVGLPDEMMEFELREKKDADVDYVRELARWKKDASVDRYSYRLPGASGEFIIMNGNVLHLPSSPNIIELIGEKSEGVYDFRITTPDGTKYEFCEREHTQHSYSSQYIQPGIPSHPGFTAVSTWYLSRIVTPESADQIDISYSVMPSLTRSLDRPAYAVSVRDDGGLEHGIQWLTETILNSGFSKAMAVYADRRIPLGITSRTGSVDFTYSSTAYNGRQEVYLAGFTLSNSDGNIIRCVSFKTEGYENRMPRRKLTSFTVKDDEGKLVDSHEFLYKDDRVSEYGDVFGYPNAPSSDFSTSLSVIDEVLVRLNPRRASKPAYIAAGAMTRHTSAGGVITDYVYEPSTVQAGDSVATIGVRIKSISANDLSTGRVIKREFSYSEPQCDMKLEWLTLSDFTALSGMKWYSSGNGSLPTYEPVYDTTATLMFGCRRPGAPLESARILYGRVDESVSGTGIDEPLLSRYEYDLSRCKLQNDNVLQSSGTPSLAHTDRSLSIRFFPIYGNSLRHKLFTSSSVQTYHRERIGGAPELRRLTTFRHNGRAYEAVKTEERFYFTADSTSRMVDFFQEPSVRQVKNIYGLVKDDLQTMQDVNCFNVYVDAQVRLLDSIAVTRHFPDGESRVRTTRLHYTSKTLGQVIPIDTFIIKRKDIGDFIIKPSNTYNPWNSGEFRTKASFFCQTGTTVREGGHELQHHTAIMDMSLAHADKKMASRGLRSLPVREMWVLDRCDTLTRAFSYAGFQCGSRSLTRLSSIKTLVGADINDAGGMLDRLDVLSYSQHGLPTTVTQTGKPKKSYEWGYSGDELTAYVESDASVGGSAPNTGQTSCPTLRHEYEHVPLVGCTGISYPSGKSAGFVYSGQRLSEVRNSAGNLVQDIEYLLYQERQDIGIHGANEIRTTDYGKSATPGDAASVAKHYDGFGLESAVIREGYGGDGQDNVSVCVYDALGRVTENWLPFSEATASDLPQLFTKPTKREETAIATYDDDEAVSLSVYPQEVSKTPLSVTLGGTGYAEHPAKAWETCSSTTVTERKVKRWKWNGSRLSLAGIYADGELDCVRREDGDGRVLMVFTDCLGRQVLSRKVLSDDEFADTYTVCDAWGNPLIVIPPELSSQGGGTTGYVSTNLIRDYAFIRSYDRKRRLRMSKMPGCEPVRYAYDADNRLVLSRDGNQSVDGTMSFVLRDALGREVLAGTCASENGDVFDIGSDDLEPPVCSLSASTTTTSGSLTGTAVSGYAVGGGSLSLPENAQVLTAGYYDGYSFFSGDADSPFAAVASHCAAPVGALTAPKGLLTATLSAVSGKGGVSKLLPCVNYYDDEERLVRSVEQTHRGDILTRDFTYSMAGMKLSEKQTLLMPDGTSHSVMTSNTYDAFGRLTSATVSIDGDPAQTLHRMTFDALGRVIVDSIPANTTYFEYDCHGWTTQIGRTGLIQNYDYADGANPSYSGKITLRSINQIVIRNKRIFKSRNIYSYEYDALGRLSSAAFTRRNGTALTSTDFSTSYDYDLNSNITQISRNGLIATNTYGEIDNVSLSFSGNQLTSMTEEAGTVLLENSLDIPEGIWENGDFEYDANGNQTRDMSRDIEDIKYDSCNRPVKVTTADEEIDFLYSADGTKLAQIIPENDIRRDYCGAFELCDGVLERVHVDNGFFTAADSVLHVYLRDIQGGVLAVYNTAGSQMEQIVETYPYGMPHSSGTLSEVDVNRRWFGGKEFTAESGVNLYDFNARWLNPALAMFTTPDPLAFNTPDVSPYTFCAGDPVNYSDPTGEVIIFINGFHWGDGGKSEYWEGLDKRIMHSFGDYKCLYFDGSFGGYKNFPKNLSHHYRFKHGFELGYKMAWIIRESLSPDETIKIVSHSMGSGASKGFILGLTSLPELGDRVLCEIDLAPYKSGRQQANPVVPTLGISHHYDPWVWKSRIQNAKNYHIPSIKPWNSHSITTFPNDLNLIKQWMKSLIDPDKNENDTSDKTKQ